MPSSFRTDRIAVLSVSLLVGAAIFLAFSPEVLSVATGGSAEAKYRVGDVVVYKLDKSLREVTGSEPAMDGYMLYELAPVEDATLDTIWVAEDDVISAED